MPSSSSLALRAALACVLLAACPPKEPARHQVAERRGDRHDDKLPERPPIERSGELMATGKHAEALAVLDDALKATPDDPELHYARGIALAQLGKPQDAIAAWQAAVQRKPDFYPALNGIGAVQLDAGQGAEAIVSFKAAIAAKPDFPDAHYNLGRAHLLQGDVAAARTALEAANRLAPEDVDVLLLLTELHRKAGRGDDALLTAKRRRPARPRRPRGPPHPRPRAHGEGRVHAAAQAEFSAALQKKPDDVDAKLGLARALMKLDRAEEALVPLADLAARLPDQAIVWSEWGAALAKLGKFDGPEGALAKLDKALTLKPDLASAHIRKVGALAQAKQCKQAKEALKAFTARKPKPEALDQAKDRRRRLQVAPSNRLTRSGGRPSRRTGDRGRASNCRRRGPGSGRRT
jgi:tetratricopeptide (TPR) repeat protein